MALGVWNRLQTLLFGGAIGAAASDAVRAPLEPVRQQAWEKNQNRVLEPGTLAQLVAQGAISLEVAEAQAARNGFDPDKVAGLVSLALEAPPYAEVLDLWRRGKFGAVDPKHPPPEVLHAFAKAQIEQRYWEPLGELFFERLSVQDVAVMVQRGILPNPGWLPVGPPEAVGKVPPMPQATFDPVAEAQSTGFDPERASALAKIIGLPASPDLAARMTFRGIIDRIDFDRAISEGNTRNEWAPFMFEGFRQIPTAHDFIEQRLRGWVDDTAMYAGTARHGMSKADTDTLFQITGRPISAHQVFVGLLRGGIYNGPVDQIDPAYLKSLQESNVRPEWYNLLWAGRYTYPSVFATRALAQAGTLTYDETLQILTYEAWEPTLAAAVAKSWTGGTTAAPTAKALTDAEVRRAWYLKSITEADALARLEKHGYTPADALLYLHNTTKAPPA